MHDRDRFKLIRPYSTPRIKYGDVVFCELRGEVKIVGLSTGRIPWPKCRSGKRARAIILYGALADAVRLESAQAVGYWWGVGSYTWCQWRKALGVPPVNAGTKRLKRDYADARGSRRLRGRPTQKHATPAIVDIAPHPRCCTTLAFQSTEKDGWTVRCRSQEG